MPGINFGMNHHPLKLDLNNLFKPAIIDGIENLSKIEATFSEAHTAITVLKKTGQLPFSRQPAELDHLESVMTLAKTLTGYDNVVVLGIGGSALGTSSVVKALGVGVKPALFVVDYLDATELNATLEKLRGKKNLFLVISKSGNTTETLSQYLYFSSELNVKKDDVIILTDPQTGFLREYAGKEKIRTLDVPPGVGGRFSVFTAVGLLPLTLCGVNVEEMLLGAQAAEFSSHQNLLAANPSALLAASLHWWISTKKITQVVCLSYASRLNLFADWLAQLWGESLGKRHTLSGDEVFTGTTLVKASGVADQHSQLQLYLEGPRDKIILFVDEETPAAKAEIKAKTYGDERLDFLLGRDLTAVKLAERQATEESLREAGRPNACVTLSQINAYQVGQLYQTFMNVIPYLGAFLNINPYDQPAVERIKRFTFGLLGRKGFEDYAEKMKDHPKKSGLVF